MNNPFAKVHEKPPAPKLKNYIDLTDPDLVISSPIVKGDATIQEARKRRPPKEKYPYWPLPKQDPSSLPQQANAGPIKRRGDMVYDFFEAQIRRSGVWDAHELFPRRRKEGEKLDFDDDKSDAGEDVGDAKSGVSIHLKGVGKPKYNFSKRESLLLMPDSKILNPKFQFI